MQITKSSIEVYHILFENVYQIVLIGKQNLYICDIMRPIYYLLNYLIMLKSISKFIKKHSNKILAGIAFMAGTYFFYKCFEDQSQINFSVFKTAMIENKIDEVIFSDNSTIFFKDNNSNWFRTYFADLNITDVYKMIIDRQINFSSKQSIISEKTATIALTTCFSYFITKYAISALQGKDIGNSQMKSNIYQTGNSFKDFYGGEQIKEKFMEIIDFLNNPEKYQSMGARIRRGIVFYGPPGTGKTLLARALANQAGCNFIKIAASQFQEIFAGVGPKRVRQLFREARRSKNGCIIFIDQLDSLGSRVNHLRDSHQTTTTINQFLSEMDGFQPIQKIVVVGATNRMDLVDQAILRAGRFDLKIHVPLPTIQQKKGIFKTILNKKVKDLHNIQDDTINYIAENSHQWSGADFQALINQSIYKAIQQNRQFISAQNALQSFQELKALHK